MRGTCGLCGSEADLQRSHLLPAGLFKAVIQGHAPYDNAPVLLNIPGGTAVQSNFQARKPFLCTPCEQRFSADGEAHVIAQCHRKDGEFLLRDLLKTSRPSAMNRGRGIYFGEAVPDAIQQSAYQYFALSVIWRACSTEWPGEHGLRVGSLGPYEPPIRRYLLGEAPFPDTVSLNVYVNFEANPEVFLSYPTCSKIEVAGYRFVKHELHIPGSRFIALIGKNVPAFEQQGLPFTNPGHPTFFEWHPKNTPFRRKLISDVSRLTNKGKLAGE